MTAATKPKVLSKDEARIQARRINDQGVAEPLVQQSLLCEDSLWQELLTALQGRGTNISREFRRWAGREVQRDAR